ncbi:hypothetical protein AN639_06585 [Candidatus Epulonipiscium fishelsonii]|nr:hypothetical protein AN639_06585 [Epulopiscium sp. SCG-B05WGA-EpuloA1]
MIVYQFIETVDISNHWTFDSPKKQSSLKMVGENTLTEQRKKMSPQQMSLEVKDFSSGTKFKDINFNLHKGEVLGIAGLAGAGRTELVRSLFGALTKKTLVKCI